MCAYKYTNADGKSEYKVVFGFKCDLLKTVDVSYCNNEVYKNSSNNCSNLKLCKLQDSG